LKIERIHLYHVNLPLVSPFITSLGVQTHVEHIIIKIEAEGIVGWGECVAEKNPFYSYETTNTAWDILKDFLIPYVLNHNLDSVNQAVKLFSNIRGHKMAKAGLEAALWDGFAKSKNISLSKMFGGVRKKIDVGVSVGLHSTFDELLKNIELYLLRGYKRIKLKISPGKDTEVIKEVRKIFPEILLQVDANSSYTIGDFDILKSLDKYNLLMIEQPLSHEDLYEHSLLQKNIKTPLCLDESINSLSDVKAALELESCKTINIKPGRVGGFKEAKTIHDFCYSIKFPLWHGGMLESGIGRAGNIALASLPGFIFPGDISESKRYFKDDIIEPEFTLNPDGTLDVPDLTGIGVEINISRLKKVTLRGLTFCE